MCGERQINRRCNKLVSYMAKINQKNEVDTGEDNEAGTGHKLLNTRRQQNNVTKQLPIWLKNPKLMIK
jgi:hypothetical protein